MERMPLLKKSRCEHDQIIGFCLDCEKAHADALAEALRALRDHGAWSHDALTCGHPNDHLATASNADAALAAHDKRRRK